THVAGHGLLFLHAPGHAGGNRHLLLHGVVAAHLHLGRHASADLLAARHLAGFANHARHPALLALVLRAFALAAAVFLLVVEEVAHAAKFLVLCNGHLAAFVVAVIDHLGHVLGHHFVVPALFHDRLGFPGGNAFAHGLVAHDGFVHDPVAADFHGLGNH